VEPWLRVGAAVTSVLGADDKEHKELTVTKAMNKMAKKIAAEIKNMGLKTPAEQMAAYCTIGGHIRDVVWGNETEYGPTPVLDLVARVPELKSEEYALRIMNLSDLWSSLGEDVRDYVLEETARPMSNGQYLSPTHWSWLLRHKPEEPSPEEELMPRYSLRSSRHQSNAEPVDERGQWLSRELAWIRKESPSAAVLEHVEEILQAEHERETDRLRESVRDAVHTLELL
jgi:hypothetical protein